jgi:hypothetical protein
VEWTVPAEDVKKKLCVQALTSNYSQFQAEDYEKG